MEDFFVPCMYKYFLGFDCPACGGQRATYLLFQGKFEESFFMYPPLIPFFIFLIILILKWKNKKWLAYSGYTLLTIVFANYFYKMIFL